MKKTSLYQIIFPFIVSVCILVGLPILLSTFIMHSKTEWQGPDAGLWYCEDLQLQICLQSDIEYIDVDTGLVNSRSYILVDGDPVMCEVAMHRGTYTLCVINQDPSAGSELASTVFEGEYVSLDAQNYTVRTKDGTTFTFERIKEFSLEQLRNHYKQQIDAYNGAQSTEKAPHIAIAIDKTKELWKNELGINPTDEKLTVAYDFTSDCWLVSGSSKNAPVSLIDMNGKVIGVFKTGDGSIVP